MPVTREGARAAAYPRAVIVAAVVSPHPPLLLRELTGRVDVAAGLRATAVSALAGATAPAPDVVVVVGGDDTGGAWDPALPLDVRRFGTTGARPSPGTPTLPLSLAVGRRLLDEAGWSGPTRMHAVARDASAADVDALAGELTRPGERAVLLVLGDGSARRLLPAPGYLEERAFPYDDELAGALERGDADLLEHLDPGLADELMVLGRSAFAVLGAAVRREGATPRARLLHRDDPFGVTYLVALWQLA